MLSIPFEDLDIHSCCPIILREDAFYDKIIKHRREGFAKNSMGPLQLTHESWLQGSHAFYTGRDKNGGFSPDFDHMALMVKLEDRWLADVGFGDLFTEPKRRGQWLDSNPCDGVD